LVIPPGAWAATGTVPANICLQFQKGGYFTVANGVTVTINGPVEAGLYQIFSYTGTGVVVFGSGSNSEVKPEWWGAKGDDSTDCTASMSAAATAASTTNTLVLSNGTYRITGTTGTYALSARCNIKGQSPNTSIIKNVGTGHAVKLAHTSSIYYSRYENFSVVGNALSEDGITTGGATTGNTNYSAFNKVDSTSHGQHGLVMRNTWATRFIDCKFSYNSGLGVYIQYVSGDTSPANATSFINCEARWNGGTGNAGADYTKGGVRIDGCNNLLWLGGVVESNNAWGFIVGEGADAINRALRIDGVFLEDIPKVTASSTVGGLFRASGKWNNLSIVNCWGSYGGELGTTAYAFYITNTLVRETYDCGDSSQKMPVFEERNNWIARGASGTMIYRYVGQNILYNHGVTRENLLSNSGFSIWSNGVLANVGDQISVTVITAGVCTTADTEGLVAGKLVKFGAGGSTANQTYVVTAVVANTTFTIHNTAITDATAVTCYEVTPGCAHNNLGPDAWVGDALADIYREHSGSNTLFGSFYALKSVSIGDNAVLYQKLNRTGAYTSTDGYQGIENRTLTFGCWVKADAVGIAKLAFYDRVASPVAGTLTYSATNITTDWEWLELTRTFPASALDRGSVQLINTTSGHTVYFSQPMLVRGSSIGTGNYAPKSNDDVNLDAPITFATFSAVTTVTDRTVYIEAETLGKLGKGISNIWLDLLASQDAITSGKGFRLQTSSTNASGFSLLPQVANVAIRGTGKVGVSEDSTIYADYTPSGTLTTTVGAIAVTLK
jgi:hypothetical protein